MRRTGQKIRDDLIVMRDWSVEKSRELAHLSEEFREVYRTLQSLINKSETDAQAPDMTVCLRDSSCPGRDASADGYISVTEAASQTGLSKRTIQNWCKGELSDAARKRGSAWRLEKRAFHTYAQARGFLPDRSP